jgi:ubiquinone/menaquinone biosynthesis C-methylase UbiE
VSMEYIPTGETSGARKFHGSIADGYDAKRERSPKWTIEQAHIEDMLSDLAPGSIVFDCPCGTGRFFKFYHLRGLKFVGMDISRDMLTQAANRVVDPPMCDLIQGDIRATGGADKVVDASVMCRLTRWLSPDDCVLALKELQRITKSKIIFTARVRNHPHARTYALIESALDGWKIARDEAGADLDYRIIELRPV